MRALWIGMAAAGAAALLVSCGGGGGRPSGPPAGPAPTQFTPELMDFDRPCTLLTPTDASSILGQPFFRTLAADSVEENRVRCAQTVGEGGLQGVAELTVEYPIDDQTAEETFLDLCRASDMRSLAPGDAVAMQSLGGAPGQRPVSAAPTDVLGRACVLADGGVALMLPDRVLRILVRDGAGAPMPDQSAATARLVSQRVVAQRR